MADRETEFAEIRDLDGFGFDVLVVITPMTKAQARGEFPYRPFEPKPTKLVESRYGGVGYDGGDLEMMMNKKGAKCLMCEAPTKNEFLVEGVCPDCDGRAEAQNNNPRTLRSS